MVTCKQLVDEASVSVPSIDARAAIAAVDAAQVVFVDVRDEPELVRFGKIPGAVHVSRGTLEFAIDPAASAHNPVFASGLRIVFYCTTGARSALAANLARQMGVAGATNLEGGVRGWIAAGGRVESHAVSQVAASRSSHA